MFNDLRTDGGLSLWLWERQFEIRHAIRRAYKANSFCVDEISANQHRRVNFFKEVGLDVSRCLQTDWNTIDGGRASAVCLLEQFRARAWALGILYKPLPRFEFERFHITLRNIFDRLPEGNLSRFNLQAYKQRMSRVLASLKKLRPDMVAIGTVEILAVRNPGGSVHFEPQLHLVIQYATREQIRCALQPEYAAEEYDWKSSRSYQPYSPRTLAHSLAYMFKFTPLLLSRTVDQRAQFQRGYFVLTGAAHAEWIIWMSQHKIHELLIVCSEPSGTMDELHSCNLQMIVEELLLATPKHRAAAK